MLPLWIQWVALLARWMVIVCDLKKDARMLYRTIAGWCGHRLRRLNEGPGRGKGMNATGLWVKSLLVLSMMTLPACMTVPKGLGNYDAGCMERGYASWYGGNFQGRPTASGEIYDQSKMTAAHRLLPLGSVVRVTNAENGREAVVVINDRGPFIRGRVIDLSYAAAERLGTVESGTLPVLIKVVQMGSQRAKSPFVHRTGLKKGNGFAVGRHALRVMQSGSPHDGAAWLSEVESPAGRVTRGRMDVFQDQRRSRRLAYLSNRTISLLRLKTKSQRRRVMARPEGVEPPTLRSVV